MIRQVLRAGTVGVLLLLLCATTAAAPLKPDAVPEPLKPWIDWALAGDRTHHCPFLFNNFAAKRCAWPGALTLDISPDGAQFVAEWEVFAPSWIAVPGDQKHWPQDVRINGAEHALVARAGMPSVFLEPGQYRVSGEFSWRAVPQHLRIPRASGLVSVIVDGTPRPLVRVDKQGRLWLGEGAELASTQTATKNQHSLTVMRRIIDDVPMQVQTRIELDVTGEPTEVTVGRPLLDGFIPISIHSPIPARIDADGMLRLQLRPGRHVVSINARHPQRLSELGLAGQAAPWPSAEVWSFEARHALRLVEISGVDAVDPRQTRVPEGWRGLPTFSVAAGSTMRLTEIRRGDPEPEADRLSLHRQLWLDFDGAAYTTHDRISGTLTRSWRVTVGPDLMLGQVVANGVPRFITTLANGSAAGVELREATLDLQADARMARKAQGFSAVGWAHDFHSVEAALNLPPGWDVFAIHGVDNNPRTWLARWTLLDLFLVLVLSVAMYRLWGWRVGVLALAALILVWHAPGAPRFVWISLIVAVTLLRVLPRGRFRQIVSTYRLLTVFALIAISIPFVVNELRLVFYPQLAQVGQAFPYDASLSSAHRPIADAPPSPEVMEQELFAGEDAMVRSPAPAILAEATSVDARKQKAVSSTKSRPYEIDPGAIVQTGPGLPEWRWRSLQLRWNGPVDQDQRIAVTYIPPWLSAVLHCLRVFLLVALLGLLLYARGRRLSQTVGGLATCLLATAMAISVAPRNIAAAGFPDTALLETLRERLVAPPECENACAEITRMHLEADETKLQIRFETHSVAQTAIPLPGHVSHWLPTTVLLDGQVTSAMAHDGGLLWLQVPPGVHQVTLSGALPARAEVQITFGLRPRRFDYEVVGWDLRGVRDDGGVAAQLQLKRHDEQLERTSPTRLEPNRLPPFIRVARSLRLDLDWTVTTTVTRGAAGESAAVIEVPLLTGESVVTPGIDVGAGKVRVNLAPGRGAFSWESVLENTTSVTLVAPGTHAWLESWHLDFSPLWHVEVQGIAPIQAPTTQGLRVREWRPWPGESITLAVSKPHGVPGQTLTIDSSAIDIRPGKRATDASLRLSLRSSKGGQYQFLLPEAAELQTVRIDGRAAAVRPEGRQLTIPVKPGAQAIEVNWVRDGGIVNRFVTAPLDFGIESTNHLIKVTLGRDRWTLFTAGPRMGPAVLHWSLLAALLIVALGLARLPWTPLTTAQWLLIAIGLSQVPIPLAAIVVLWLLALGVRARYAAKLRGYQFNLVQIGLGILTIGAFAVLIEAIRHGLLGTPNMHVAGNDSSAHLLRWYADRVAAQPPTAMVISVPILVYRLAMLAWALWLAMAILRWLRWGWECFGTDGLWRPWRSALATKPSPNP